VRLVLLTIDFGERDLNYSEMNVEGGKWFAKKREKKKKKKKNDDTENERVS
jgi:hypothetical protein